MKQLILTLTLLAGSAAFAQTAPAPSTPPAPTTPAPAAPAAPATPAPATATPAPAADPSAVVATVGGSDFTLGQFEAYYRQTVARTVNAQGIPLSDDVLPYFGQYRGQILDSYARQQAILQLAAKGGYTAAAADVDKAIKDAQAGFTTPAELTDALAGSGFTSLDEYRATLERELAVRAYTDAIKKRFTFGDAVVAAYYSTNKASFNREGEACVKHILVATQPEAQAIVAQLASGGDFAAIAKEKSKDPGSAAQGGDLGCLAPGDTVPAFDKASFQGALNTPQTVQTEYGWHVLIVTKRTAAGLAPLSEVQATIRDQLGDDAAQKYLDAQLKRVTLSTKPELVKVDPPATAPGSAAPTTPAAPKAP